MDIGAMFKDSWDRFVANIGMAILIYLVGGLIGGFLSGITLGIVGIPVMAGMYKAFRKMQRGEEAEFGDLFSEFGNFGKWIKLWVVMLVIGIIMTILYFVLTITVIGIVLLPFIGIALGMFLFFTFPLMIDKDMQAFDAVKESFNKVKGNFGAYFLPILLCVIVSGLFSIITGPWMMLAAWMIYDFAYAGKDTSSAVPVPPQ